MYETNKLELCQASLEAAAKALQEHLPETFSFVDVQVTDCPNLKEKPFMLASEGLCGTPCIADVGGVEYLLPLAQKNKVYNIKEIASHLGKSNALIIGAGAGPRSYVGINCEMMANLKLGDEEFINTHIAKLDKEGNCELVRLENSTEFCLLGNLFICDGKPGKVIKVVAKQRIGSNNFVTAMRNALAKNFKNCSKPVGMGGIFVIKKGKAKLHIMPDYSKTPLKSGDDVNKWLQFFDMPTPLSCLSVFVSRDPGLNLRIEHTHCFSDHGMGGHYHEDTTPDDVEYEGYFNVADVLYRLDQPDQVSEFGRD